MILLFVTLIQTERLRLLYVSRFCFILILVIVAFACGLNQLYWYYAEKRTEICEDCVKANGKNDCDQECDKTLRK